jgi:hypothetical protein
MNSLSRPTIIAAGLGGLLWTVKALVITANDGSFGTLENICFIGGLLALVAAAVLAGIDTGRSRRGLVGAAAGIATCLGLVAATLLLEQLGKGAVSALATGDNLGLEEEGGILVCGLAWMALSARSAIARRPRVSAVAA